MLGSSALGVLLNNPFLIFTPLEGSRFKFVLPNKCFYLIRKNFPYFLKNVAVVVVTSIPNIDYHLKYPSVG
jgi:hypothetical protein